MTNAKQRNSNDFELNLNKESVKQGRSFKALLESSDAYRKQDVFWKITGNGITKDDLSDGKLQGQITLKNNGSHKQYFDIAKNSDRDQNDALTVTYYFDSKFKKKIADASIDIIAKSFDPDDDPDQPWKLTSARKHVKENVSVITSIANAKPKQTVYYDVTGKGIDSNDFDLNYGRTSGKAKIDAFGRAQIPFMVRADHKTEGEETFKLTIYKDKSLKKKISSVSIPIDDVSKQTDEQGPTKSVKPTKKQPTWSGVNNKGTWFTFSPSRTSIRENTSTRTRIDSDSKEGSVLYFDISGKGIDQNDFDLAYGRTSGEIVTNSNGTALIPHLIRNDNQTEGVETMEISLYRDKKRKKLVASTTIPIEDSSVETPGNPPTQSPVPNTKQPRWGGGVNNGSWFTLSPSRTDFNRGESVETRVDSNSLPGAVLSWKLSGPGIDLNDLDLSSDNSGLSGDVTIEANGFALIKHTFKADNQTSENTEITIDLFRKGNPSKEMASTSFMLVATPAEAEPNKFEINEGKSMKFKVFTRGIPEGENVYWEATGLNITDGDFVSARTGVATLDESRKFQVNFEASKDVLTEGTEFFQLNLYTDPEKTNLIGSSEYVTIFDTSTTPIQSYSLESSADIVTEGKGFKIKVKTKNVDRGEIIHWKGYGPAADNDVVYLENSNLLNGSVPLDGAGNAILQFRSNKNTMLSSSSPFSFGIFNTENYLDPITEPITVTILER